MSSRLAKIRLVADSIDAAFRGSNPLECEQFTKVRQEFAQYLFKDIDEIPTNVIDRLGPIAESLIASCKSDMEIFLAYYE